MKNINLYFFTKVSEQMDEIWVRRYQCGFSSLGSTLATAISLLCVAEALCTYIDFVHNGGNVLFSQLRMEKMTF